MDWVVEVVGVVGVVEVVGMVGAVEVVGMKEKKTGVIGPKKKNDDERDPPPDHAARGW